MILQCELCKTRFRLDDSKLKPGGVKVRCSKCRHVFVAGAEEPQHDESEFDAILSGLGAPPQAPPQGRDLSTPVPEHSDAFCACKVESPVSVPTPSAPETPQQPPFEAGFGSQLEGAGATAVLPEQGETAPSAAQPDAETLSTEGWGDFDFNESAPEPESAPPAEADFDFGEFSFEPEAAAPPEPPSASGEDELDFSAFSFEEEPAPEPASAPAQPLPFGEFDLEEGEVKEAPVQATENREEFDFGEFSFDEAEPAAAPDARIEPPQEMKLDFGEFSLDEEPPQKQSAPPSLAEPVQKRKGEELPAATVDFGAFSFDEPPVQAAAEASLSSQAGAIPREPEPDQEPASVAGGGAAVLSDHDFGLDFGPSLFGEPKAAAPKAEAEQPSAEEELPPLSISSRRKGHSVLTISMVVVSATVVVALSGAGFYLMQSGPATFEKLGLGFAAKWLGVESPEEGRITIKNPLASFYQNKEVGELFVVSGEAINSFKKARAAIHVKVTLYDKNGAPLVQKTAYCGNRLTKQQLETLPLSKLDAIMGNQFGDSLANLGVQPGRGINFVVAMANVPKEAADFGVEVIGSTVAGP